MSLAPLRLAVSLTAYYLLLAAVTVGAGSLRLTGHEVDFIHSVDIAFRLKDGAAIHTDFMTPLGILAFKPLQFFLERGYGPGMSFLLGQAMVGAILLPGIWWFCMSRLAGWLRFFTGMGLVAIAMSIIFGGDTPALTVAMYYNRWAWVLAAFVIFAIALPARPGWRAPLVDGVIVGLAGAALLLIKVTYVVALLPAVVLYLLRARPWRFFAAATLAALAAVAVATVVLGPGHWAGYVGDLLAVRDGPMRQHPGPDLWDLVASPETLSMHVLILVAVVLWRRSGADEMGLMMLVLAPGLIYIVYQNWGNDPKWLLFLAVFLLAVPLTKDKPFFGVPPLVAARILAVLALVFYLPSALNILTSPFRNAAQPASEFSPLIPGLENADILSRADRKYAGAVEMPYSAITQPEWDDVESAEEAVTTFTVSGETFPNCEMTGGFIGFMWQMGEQLGAVEEAVGQPVYVADIYDFLWLFAPTQPVRGVGPWFYGGAAEEPEADYVVVPFCAISEQARRLKLEDLQERRGWSFDEILRTELFMLLRRADPSRTPAQEGTG